MQIDQLLFGAVNEASFLSLFLFSTDLEQGHHFCISCMLLTFVQPVACASYDIDL